MLSSTTWKKSRHPLMFSWHYLKSIGISLRLVSVPDVYMVLCNATINPWHFPNIPFSPVKHKNSMSFNVFQCYLTSLGIFLTSFWWYLCPWIFFSVAQYPHYPLGVFLMSFHCPNFFFLHSSMSSYHLFNVFRAKMKCVKLWNLAP